ncbi:12784_t:CDS:2, partial [Ambispora gerdemannii]
MSTTFSKAMPSLVKSIPETSSHKSRVTIVDPEESVVSNPVQSVETKKIVLLKRPSSNSTNGIHTTNPTTIDNSGESKQSSPINSNGNNNNGNTSPIPSRSETYSPTSNGESPTEESVDLGEIDAATGLDNFLLTALKNPKDRLFLLKLDQDMANKYLLHFVSPSSRLRLEFPQMNSYQRLIVHRVAQYFKLSHVVDSSGKAVVLYKSAETAIPILRFSDLEQEEEKPPEKSVKIMRRQSNHPSIRSVGDNSDSNSESERRTHLTIEEREAAYQKARARIFKDKEKKDSEQEETEGSRSPSP